MYKLVVRLARYRQACDSAGVAGVTAGRHTPARVGRRHRSATPEYKVKPDDSIDVIDQVVPLRPGNRFNIRQPPIPSLSRRGHYVRYLFARLFFQDY